MAMPGGDDWCEVVRANAEWRGVADDGLYSCARFRCYGSPAWCACPISESDWPENRQLTVHRGLVLQVKAAGRYLHFL